MICSGFGASGEAERDKVCWDFFALRFFRRSATQVVEEIIWNLYFICFVFLCYGTVKKTKIEKPSDDDPPNGKVLNFSQKSLVSLLCVPPLLFLFLFGENL